MSVVSAGAWSCVGGIPSTARLKDDTQMMIVFDF